MTNERVRELKQIAARLYVDVLDSMGTHKYGHVFAGVEETIVLSAIITKMQIDLQNWITEDVQKEVD